MIILPLKKIVGFGSVIPRYGSEVLDLYQNVADPEHWLRYTTVCCTIRYAVHFCMLYTTTAAVHYCMLYTDICCTVPTVCKREAKKQIFFALRSKKKKLKIIKRKTCSKRKQSRFRITSVLIDCISYLTG